MKKETKSIIFRYYAFSLFSNLGFFGSIVVPFFTMSGHISLFQIQMLQSWYSFWFFLLEVPTGIIADRFGRKYTMASGAVIAAIGLFLYGTEPHFISFLIAECIMALGTSLMSGANDALLYETLKQEGLEKESKKYFGRANSFQLIGILVGGIAGSGIAVLLGLNAPFILSTIPLFIAACIAWSFKETKLSKKDSDILDIKNHGEMNPKKGMWASVRNGYSYLLTHKVLRLLTIDSLVIATCAYFVFWLYQPFLQQSGVSLLYFGVFNAVFLGSEILISHNFIFLEKLCGSAKGYLRFSAIAVGIGFFTVAIHPNLLTILIFIILAGGLGYTRRTLITSYMQQFIPSEQRATVLSSVSTFHRLAITILNPLVGLIATHSLQIAALTLGIFPLLLFVFSPVEQHMFEDVGIIEVDI